MHATTLKAIINGSLDEAMADVAIKLSPQYPDKKKVVLVIQLFVSLLLFVARSRSRKSQRIHSIMHLCVPPNAQCCSQSDPLTSYGPLARNFCRKEE